MQIQQLNQSDAEVVKIVVKNVDGGGALTTGLGVSLVQAGASIDGLSAVQHLAANQEGFVGVANQDIAINGFGLVTCWGLASSIDISNEGSSVTITRGDFLVQSGVAGRFSSSLTDQAMSTHFYRYIIAAETTVAASAAGYIKGLVRAL